MNISNTVKDTLIILLIGIISFFFANLCKSPTISVWQTAQLPILFGLFIIVVYKLMYYNNFMKRYRHLQNDSELVYNEESLNNNVEGFNTQDVTDKLLDFVNNKEPKKVARVSDTLNETERKEHLTKIDQLINEVQGLNDRLAEVNAKQSSIDNVGNTSDRLNLETAQKMQNFQITHLQEQIEKSRRLLEEKNMQDDIQRYKPIKVYSSCAVVSADGAFEEDKPSPSNNNFNDITNVNSNNLINDHDLKSLQQIFKTTGQQEQVSSTNSLANQVSGFLNKITSDNVNINLA